MALIKRTSLQGKKYKVKKEEETVTEEISDISLPEVYCCVRGDFSDERKDKKRYNVSVGTYAGRSRFVDNKLNYKR